MPFLIRHPETRVEYELSDYDYFVAEYQPQGFTILKPQPTNYTMPEIPKPEPKAKAKDKD